MNSNCEKIKQNLWNLNKDIIDYCKLLNRNIKEIQILPVTKGINDLNLINCVINLGYKEICESYYQELEKKAKFFNNATFHFIGNIQSNKVKKLCQINNLKFVHSLARKKIAELFASSMKNELNFFVQVDYTNKENRNGLKEEEVLEFLDFCESIQLKVIGLMTYPLPKQEELAYSQLLMLKQSIENQKKIKLKISAGTSSDFKIAIKYGSNFLRIGRAIFGYY